MGEDDRVRVLGLEGTAWAASAAVFETADPTARQDDEHVFVESDAYQPDSGGIHPREAAEHMSEAVPEVARTALEHARARAADEADDANEAGAADEGAAGADGDADASATPSADAPIDAVAFSRGPGLGPCLRVVATAARTLAQRFDVPLVGVNHMVAHLEIGRHRSGFDDPLCLNASGANAHVLAHRGGRYRVLGETMDTGVGNAIDKFTRELGWSHPGGPKVEERAREGEYVELPYVVKGMDFSFAGLSSAASQAVADGTPIPDVCRGLQETVFAMLTEVSERALALTGADELVLGGGVGQNERLRAMLAAMCEQRGAAFYAPEPEFLRDNAGMIAVLGAKMLAAGDTIPVAESGVRPDFRPDEVPVTWRTVDGSRGATGGSNGGREAGAPAADTAGPTSGDADASDRGAEATVSVGADNVVKERQPRSYRHPALDERLRTRRTRREARLLSEARRAGVPTPIVVDVDPAEARLELTLVGDADLAAAPTPAHLRTVGRHLATLHDAGLVHGDPTTRNVRVRRGEAAERDDGPSAFLIDFGLGYDSHGAEDHAMDLHVLGQSLTGTSDDADALREAAIEGYRAASADPDGVLDRLREIEGRGRYQ